MKIFKFVNLAYGCVITFLAAVFGQFWYLFAAFLLLNAADYITGVLKAKHTDRENSDKGAKGVIKKVGYWMVIAIAFFIAATFTRLGALIGADLGFVSALGWLTLATFIINEIRSILENLIILGVPVPAFLTKGLEIAAKAVEAKTDEKH